MSTCTACSRELSAAETYWVRSERGRGPILQTHRPYCPSCLKAAPRLPKAKSDDDDA